MVCDVAYRFLSFTRVSKAIIITSTGVENLGLDHMIHFIYVYKNVVL